MSVGGGNAAAVAVQQSRDPVLCQPASTASFSFKANLVVLPFLEQNYFPNMLLKRRYTLVLFLPAFPVNILVLSKVSSSETSPALRTSCTEPGVGLLTRAPALLAAG